MAESLAEWERHATWEDLDGVKYDINWLTAPKSSPEERADIAHHLARHYSDGGLEPRLVSLLENRGMLHELTDSFADELWARKMGKGTMARSAAIVRVDTIDDATIAGFRLHREKMEELRSGCDLSVAKYLEHVDTVAAFAPHKRMLHASEIVRGVVMQHYHSDTDFMGRSYDYVGAKQSSPAGMRIWLEHLIRVKIQEPTRTRLCGALTERAEGFAAYQRAMAEARDVVEEHRLAHREAPSLAETLPEELLLVAMRRLPARTLASLLRCCKWTPAVRRLLADNRPQLHVFEAMPEFPHGRDAQGEAYVIAGPRGGQGGKTIGLLVALARPASMDDYDNDAEEAAEASSDDEDVRGYDVEERDRFYRRVDAYYAAKHLEGAAQKAGDAPVWGTPRITVAIDADEARNWTMQSARAYRLDPAEVHSVELIPECEDPAQVWTVAALEDAVKTEARLVRAGCSAGTHAYPMECPEDELPRWTHSRWSRRDYEKSGRVQPIYAQYTLDPRYLSGKRKRRYRLRIRTTHPGMSAVTRPFRVVAKHPANGRR